MKKTLNFKLTAALAIACSLAVPPACGADAYRALSMRIAKSAVENSIKKIAVLEFAAKGGAGKSETAYVAEKMGVQLAGSKIVALIERALLEKVLKEAGLSSAAGASDKTEILRNILSLDAVVTGVVFADGDTLRVFARLIDVRTGRVLLAAEEEAGRQQPDPLGGRFEDIELPDVSFPELPAGWNPFVAAAPRASFRDAVSDPVTGSCSGRRSVVNRLNAELVDLKARYWAIRMKTPGFDRRTLTRNPGSEIGDTEIKARFYKLLADYYRDGSAARLNPEERNEGADLIKMEAPISAERGLLGRWGYEEKSSGGGRR
ncbi:MAG: hypothetical protein Q8O90_09910 [Elusimicrobiota bacterium]|nr:hypothetical protein [Elusimicrobiota bacterium]